MNKQPEVTEKTRNTIIQTFCEMYEQMSVEKIFIKDLMQRAGYNRSTFYQYFMDIYDLRDQVEDEVLGLMQARKEESGKNVQALVDLFEQKESILKALFGTYGMVHFLEKMRAEFLPQIESECSDVPEKYRPYLEEFHIYTSISLFRLWMKRKKDLSKEELFGLIHTLYNKGYMGVCEKS
ncbi:TetR/AcrR family transcriptional regulator [Eubacterium ramulus]